MGEKYRIIGDVHGKMGQYLAILDHAKIKGIERSIQVGDFGIGFQPNPVELYDVHNHWFIRGNHDSPMGCRDEPNYIPDGTFWEKESIMFVGGAVSIDKEYRTPGVSWWEDEELSMEELYNIYDKYVMTKPRVMITHETPEFIADQVMASVSRTKYEISSRTRQCFQSMFESSGHKPDEWYFGHWHVNFDRVILGTRFVCLNELHYIDIEL